MPEKAMSVREAAQIAQKIADEMKLEMVDAELVKEPTGHFLRFYVDMEGGITLDQLEAFHRKLQPLVERVNYDYMEVCSPGADRPLKTQRDLDKALGKAVQAKTYKPVNGVKRFVGTLSGFADGVITIAAAGGEIALNQKEVAVIRPFIEVDEAELMRALPDEEPPRQK